MYELGTYKDFTAVSSTRSSLLLNAFLKTCGEGKYLALPWNVCTELCLSIIDSGIIPYFVDVNDKYHVNEKQINRIPSYVKMYLNIHQYGQWTPIGSQIRNKFKIVIDDAAQAFGAGTHENYAGFEGDIGLLSFGNSKHISIGGGLLLTKNKYIAHNIINLLSKTKLYDIEKSEHFNRNIMFKKIKEFEYYNFTDWHNLKFRNKVIKPNLKIPSLKKYFKLIDLYKEFGKKRLIKAKLFASFLPKFIGEVSNLNEYDSPWRININANKFSHKKYIKIFNLIRSNNIVISNWYYPSHLIFKNNSKKNFNIKNKFQRFQFIIDNIEDSKKINKLFEKNKV